MGANAADLDYESECFLSGPAFHHPSFYRSPKTTGSCKISWYLAKHPLLIGKSILLSTRFFQKLLLQRFVMLESLLKLSPSTGNISLLCATKGCILFSSYCILIHSSLYAYQNNVHHICLNAYQYHCTLAFFGSDTLSFQFCSPDTLLVDSW